ncbi:DNA mismatch repair endonuclease MutL [Brevibacillus fulvus]|uniref:DNA mismatch repair protein MutL n=1 Tax=Brevibacillus fulvus TaxID=1125967 RepID=A0A939BVC4_9BACL|nr:DNA mismatch repair endonuclease MutL [Brevibacillus fulvus]MBM7590521.1 DNA mismatch repair protein MutL [Brevibacillus fulvus]
MGKIRILEEQLTNMIAAGEVVERPASVVKELIENAVDADARRIEIEVEEGGLQLIRVVDDGHGMDRDDCRAAFERHATSKIQTTRDLFHLRTLGFRGEALPSIASVAKVELVSSLASGQVGTRIKVEGGRIAQIEDAARVKGTEICVRDLFYNTPARLKYMKSLATEIGHISDYVNRLALTYPHIAFTLLHNGKTLLQTSGDGKLLHVMAAIYGVQVAKLLLPIQGETLDYTWSGFLSKTEVTRANRSYLSTLVNGRYIRNYALHNAIMRGYHTLLPVGRYPIVVLQIEMDPTLVDVNVHPAKLEVRFSKEEELCRAIEQSVQSTLRERLAVVQPLRAERSKTLTQKVLQPQFDWQPARQSSDTATGASIRQWLQPPGEPSAAELPLASAEAEAATSGKMWLDAAPTIIDRPAPEQLPLSGQEEAERDRRQEWTGQPSLREAALPYAPTPTEAAAWPRQGAEGAQEQQQSTETEPNREAVPLLFPVGQVHGTYIVAQNDTGMYLIDQHAAQERIFYELFMRKLREQSVASQIMLFPHTIECTVAEAERLQKRLPVLQSFGLEIEAFGARTFIVRAHPHWFPEGSELEIMEELIQFVLEASEAEQADVVLMREKAAILMACKASIKANRFLTFAEMESLLNTLRETSSPFTCPHGRPIILHFSTYDLEKMFKRTN